MQLLAGLVILCAVLSPYIVFGDTIDDDFTKSHPVHHYTCHCTYNYDPVCGTNGKTYPNICVLMCASKYNVDHGYPQIYVASHGECPKHNCICPAVFKPVCGSNNHTYSNDCFLTCENEWRKKYGLHLISIAYEGVCQKSRCCCYDDIIPVCGSNGKTYRNICHLQCASLYYQSIGLPPISVKSVGACPAEVCKCTPVDDPICGTDRNTYKNKCVLDCENRRLNQLGLPSIGILHKGKCNECACSKIYKPVCASDKKTYANICILGCENDRRASQNLPLLTSTPGQCACSCKKLYDPYCASDNVTYENKCLLDCENGFRLLQGLPPLTIRKRGVCPCACNKYYDPYCANNNKTYLNLCELECENAYRLLRKLPPLKIIKKGECPCRCAAIYDPWCASDDRTYPNGCTLDCENLSRSLRGLPALTIRNKGACPCFCPNIYDPLCASDGKTYFNMCSLGCENDKRLPQGKPKLMIRSRGECLCDCPKKYRPICASNNRTYGNRCWLDCINDIRVAFGLPPLTIKRYGECRCNCGDCWDNYDPVCGSDRKTYWNLCWLNCRNDCYKYTGLPYVWLVKYGEC